MKKIFCFLFVFIICVQVGNSQSTQNILLESTKKEINRSFTELKKQPTPPYFISYQIIERYTNSITASFGKIVNNTDNYVRNLDIDLRVGDYLLDNSHIIRGSTDFGGGMVGSTILPFEDDEYAIRTAIWYATDLAYRKAIEQYEKIVTNQTIKVAAEDTSADFSKESPVKYYEEYRTRKYWNERTRIFIDPAKAFAIDTAKWARVCRNLSNKFSQHQWLMDGSVSFSSELQNKCFVNTEGSEISVTESTVRIMIQAKVKSEDGMILPLYKSYFAFECNQLPDEEKISKDVDTLIQTLDKLRNAQMATTFNGPAILSGEAAGVFFHEIFGHRVEGFREKKPEASNTFKQMIGKKVLPEFLDVVFDPSAKKAPNGEDLGGYYKYDDEGMPAQAVTTVKNGVFQNFLMSRSPIEGFQHSNGHGRKSQGRTVVTRQSNLMVIPHQTKTKSEIRTMLIDEAKKQGKEYGLSFEQVSGGFTFTARVIPNAFNVMPLVVHKIYVDGRPDELVKGVDLIGTPLTTFSNIIAAADDYAVFNGVCGAESGWVPVSASSPTLLVSQIEVQKKSKSQARLPLLPSPINNIQTP